MKKALAVLLVYSLAVAAIAQEESPITVHPDGSAVISLTAAQWAQCQKEGGCAVVTGTFLQQYGQAVCKGGVGI